MSLFPFQFFFSFLCCPLFSPSSSLICWLVWMSLSCWEFVQGKATRFCSCLRENTKEPIGDSDEGLGCWQAPVGLVSPVGHFHQRGLLPPPDPVELGHRSEAGCPRWGVVF